MTFFQLYDNYRHYATKKQTYLDPTIGINMIDYDEKFNFESINRPLDLTKENIDDMIIGNKKAFTENIDKLRKFVLYEKNKKPIHKMFSEFYEKITALNQKRDKLETYRKRILKIRFLMTKGRDDVTLGDLKLIKNLKHYKTTSKTLAIEIKAIIKSIHNLQSKKLQLTTFNKFEKLYKDQNDPEKDPDIINEVSSKTAYRLVDKTKPEKGYELVVAPIWKPTTKTFPTEKEGGEILFTPLVKKEKK